MIEHFEVFNIEMIGKFFSDICDSFIWIKLDFGIFEISAIHWYKSNVHFDEFFLNTVFWGYFFDFCCFKASTFIVNEIEIFEKAIRRYLAIFIFFCFDLFRTADISQLVDATTESDSVSSYGSALYLSSGLDILI